MGTLRRLVPKRWRAAYHALVAVLAAAWYRWPSRRLIVIGVTGTTGKSTTVNWLEYLLTGQGYLVGVSSTPQVIIAGRRRTNTAKMTMPGRLALQRLLHEMVQAGCAYAIIEMTSEGLAQHRALGINVDVAVFTNLSPEHIESHGSFANYRSAKGRLFAKLASRHKRLNSVRVPKVAVVNGDDPQANFFLSFRADDQIVFRTAMKPTVEIPSSATVLEATGVRLDSRGARFQVGDVHFTLPVLGRFAVSNALAAMAVCVSQGVSLAAMKTLLASAPTVPGRMELIDAGQPFTVVVDYAHEPVSLESFYAAVRQTKPKRLLCVLGATGGGRDHAKRTVLGQIAAKACDFVFVTNEDPYDDDPEEIIDQVAGGAQAAGAEPGRTLFTVSDRRQAIDLALRTAKPHDAVVITGKGNEPWMVVKGGKKIPWDDRQIVRDLLRHSPVDNPVGSRPQDAPKPDEIS